jgi:hypothetical protein
LLPTSKASAGYKAVRRHVKSRPCSLRCLHACTAGCGPMHACRRPGVLTGQLWSTNRNCSQCLVPDDRVHCLKANQHNVFQAAGGTLALTVDRGVACGLLVFCQHLSSAVPADTARKHSTAARSWKAAALQATTTRFTNQLHAGCSTQSCLL